MKLDNSIEAVDSEILNLAWRWASTKTLAPLDHLDTVDDASDEQEAMSAFLRRLYGLDLILRRLDGLIGADVIQARALGATAEDLSGSLGITRQAIQKRWPATGDRVAVVISRRDRVRQGVDGRLYGEVGGAAQYDADRQWWLCGAEVRAKAQYAIIAVDGVVDRTYAIDPESWAKSDGKWSFSAQNDRVMTPAEIDAAGDALPLRPGDRCETRAGGSYRPHWF